MNNRRGSYTVFLVIIFSTLLVLFFSVFKASAVMGISSTADHFGRLWGTSILAEYDRNLQKRYCLYGFHGEPSVISGKLDQYAAYSFQNRNYVEYDGSGVALDGYALTETSVMKEQIAEAVLLQSHPKPMYNNKEGENTEFGSRSVTSRWILENLPSYGHKEDFSVTETAAEIKEGISLEDLTGAAAVNQYILTFFRHYRSGEELGDTYFCNEIEYILTGYADDNRARKKVKQKIVMLRNILNLAYLYSAPEKREAAMAVAAAVTPGPEAVLTQAALLELWAYAEAENDAVLLYEDETVPFLKDDRTWALTLENAMNSQEGPVRPAFKEGYDYEDYLRLFLSLVSEETKLLRTMDLIQINMKYLYHGSFRLKDYYTGLKFNLKVNGKEHEFEECYERPKGKLPG